MNSPLLKLITAWRLGPVNICRALCYRLGVRFGLNPVKALSAQPPEGPFYAEARGESVADRLEGQEFRLTAFGLETRFPFAFGIPLWHNSVLTQQAAPFWPWWQLPDFIDGLGDIKGVWEASRFDWVLGFAKQSLAGDGQALSQLNAWLADWTEKNPPYMGANWKCGQEASIRVMHLAMAAHLMGQVTEPQEGLLELVRVHMQRIAPTIQYAIAQDNNHGTSEAAALFIGGSWLVYAKNSTDGEARRWMNLGRKWLENRARRLIEADGSFSQYSLNYHRVMLDTYSMAELWRKELALPDFSAELVRRLQAATAWLGNMVSPDGGDTPNLGANDGARLLPLAETDYRDVRPSVQLASVLFAGKRAYQDSGPWDEPLQLLRVPLPATSVDYRRSCRYDQGGFAVLREAVSHENQAMLLFRYPRFRFRPGQSDLLHVDFWLDGLNVLRDAGSYSYNCDEPWQSYFPGSAAHNTVQFDDRDAMPRLSRFLFGVWPKARAVSDLRDEDGTRTMAAGYRDWKGAFHQRGVALSGRALRVTDDIKGFEKSAVLRWRLAPGEWHWKDGWLVGCGVSIRVEADQPLKRRELVEGWESRYYSQKTPLPVLEIEKEQAGRLTTELRY